MDKIYYRWYDNLNGRWNRTECEVVEFSKSGKTALIKLVTFGPNGRRPGTTFNVHTKSIEFPTKRREPDLSWHSYTDI